MFYTVGEMAKILNIAPSTLRYYDKEGMLPFVERSGSGIRMFKDEDFEWLSIIECLKKTGMSVKNIKIFIDWCMEGDKTLEKRYEIIKRQQQAVENQIMDMQKTLELLKYKSWYYEKAKEAGTCSVHDTITSEEMPEEFRHFKEMPIIAHHIK